jgi:hypothetical protein
MTVDGRTNEYKLRQSQFEERNGERRLLAMGETIKLGRVKFRVREICIEAEGGGGAKENDAKMEDDSKTDFNSNDEGEESKEYHHH